MRMPADHHEIYVSNVDPVALEDCISREVNISNNSMIVNETKQEGVWSWEKLITNFRCH